MYGQPDNNSTPKRALQTVDLTFDFTDVDIGTTFLMRGTQWRVVSVTRSLGTHLDHRGIRVVQYEWHCREVPPRMVVAAPPPKRRSWLGRLLRELEGAQ